MWTITPRPAIEGWGIYPVINIFGYKVMSYTVFMILSILVGLLLYKYMTRNRANNNGIYIVLSALLFGIIGAKIPIIIINYNNIAQSSDINLILTGKTITGGLIGGTLGVIVIKKVLGIKERMGNYLVIPILVSMAIGRIGCFLNGCCYGKETHLPWGVNFGDGILRHPTQIYEMIFDLLLCLFIAFCLYKKIREPGKLFKIFLTCYMVFRFLIEFIRTEHVTYLGLTDFQWISIIGVLFINRKLFIARSKEGASTNGIRVN